MSWQLPFCYGMAQKKAGSDIGLLGLCRTCLIATTVSSSFFFPSSQSSVSCFWQSVLESWYQIMDGKTCRDSGGSRLIFFLLCETASVTHASIAVSRTGVQVLNLTNEEYWPKRLIGSSVCSMDVFFVACCYPPPGRRVRGIRRCLT